MITEQSIREERELLTKILADSVKEVTHWIVFGIIGFSIFGVCLGILGVVSVIKVIFF